MGIVNANISPISDSTKIKRDLILIIDSRNSLSGSFSSWDCLDDDLKPHDLKNLQLKNAIIATIIFANKKDGQQI